MLLNLKKRQIKHTKVWNNEIVNFFIHFLTLSLELSIIFYEKRITKHPSISKAFSSNYTTIYQRPNTPFPARNFSRLLERVILSRLENFSKASNINALNHSTNKLSVVGRHRNVHKKRLIKLNAYFEKAIILLLFTPGADSFSFHYDANWTACANM